MLTHIGNQWFNPYHFLTFSESWRRHWRWRYSGQIDRGGWSSTGHAIRTAQRLEIPMVLVPCAGAMDGYCFCLAEPNHFRFGTLRWSSQQHSNKSQKTSTWYYIFFYLCPILYTYASLKMLHTLLLEKQVNITCTYQVQVRHFKTYRAALLRCRAWNTVQISRMSSQLRGQRSQMLPWGHKKDTYFFKLQLFAQKLFN